MRPLCSTLPDLWSDPPSREGPATGVGSGWGQLPSPSSRLPSRSYDRTGETELAQRLPPLLRCCYSAPYSPICPCPSFGLVVQRSLNTACPMETSMLSSVRPQREPTAG